MTQRYGDICDAIRSTGELANRRACDVKPASTGFAAMPADMTASVGGGGGSAGPALSEINIRRLVHDVNASFNPLLPNAFECHAAEVHNGQTLLTVAIPTGMTRFFVALLESMTGCFRLMSIKERHAETSERVRLQAIDPHAIEQRERRKAEFIDLVCKNFDAFTAQGQDKNQAIKNTLAALKAVFHPWASYEQVKACLSSQGRLRRQKAQGVKLSSSTIEKNDL